MTHEKRGPFVSSDEDDKRARKDKLNIEDRETKYYQIDRSGFSVKGWIKTRKEDNTPVLYIPISTTNDNTDPIVGYNESKLKGLSVLQLFDKLGLRWGTDNMLLSHITESENGKTLEIKLEAVPNNQRPRATDLVNRLQRIPDLQLTPLPVNPKKADN